MQNLAFVLCFASIFLYPVMGVINLASFQQEALLQHNYYRQQLHCTGGMILNASLNTIAQNYAQYLAANNIFNHSQVAGIGENLYMTYSSGGINYVNGNKYNS
ncbi:hypothetical protein I4U23_013739 [Adineta vaga]|nr:hypothetical protein I4U23_013739 [Adineta vaga]